MAALRSQLYKALLYASAQVQLAYQSNYVLDAQGNPVLDQAGNPVLDQSVTFTTGGGGIAVAGPSGLGNTWIPSQVAVNVATDVSTPVAYLYVGPNLPAYQLSQMISTGQIGQIAGTNTGNNDSIGLLNIQVPPFQALIVQWAGGDQGALATMTVTGYQSATYWQ